MIPVDLGDVARLTDGVLRGGADPGAVVTGPVVIDSRRTSAGSLFVALRGDHVDGHEFAAAAIAAGAVAVLAARDVGVPAVVVADPVAALGRLAAGTLGRAQHCRVVGITGSSGKTSTKDLLAGVLLRGGPVVAPENSYNNEIGLPLTVLSITAETRTLVAEFSARGAGHIAYLTTIAPPHVGIVLNVGSAHLGEFGSRAAIAAAKAELVEALPAGGTAVLNADDPAVAAMATRTRAAVVRFGTVAAADVRIADLRLDAAARPSFRLETPAGAVDVRMSLAGKHHAWNAAATAAAALACDVGLDDIAAGLGAATTRSPHRMSVHRRADDVLVVDDAYNANPESMRAALEAFAGLGRDRRRWAVLGEMRELGDESEQLHRSVGDEVARTEVDELIVVDPGGPIAEGATAHVGWRGRARAVADVATATAVLRAELRPGDAVLLKASNGVRLWEAAEAILADVPAGAAP